MGRPVNTIGPTRGPTYLDNNDLCAMLRFRCLEFLLLLLRRRARVPAKRSINTAKTELYIYSLSMVEAWWTLLGAAIPVFIAGQALRIKTKHAEEQRIKSARGREKGTDEAFVCERVCTSKRMLKKVGSFSKDPIPDTCVTVCGVSELDACADACARTVCVNQHQVPNWNDVCLRRCQNECLKLSVSRPS